MTVEREVKLKSSVLSEFPFQTGMTEEMLCSSLQQATTGLTERTGTEEEKRGGSKGEKCAGQKRSAQESRSTGQEASNSRRQGPWPLLLKPARLTLFGARPPSPHRH